MACQSGARILLHRGMFCVCRGKEIAIGITESLSGSVSAMRVAIEITESLSGSVSAMRVAIWITEYSLGNCQL